MKTASRSASLATSRSMSRVKPLKSYIVFLGALLVLGLACGLVYSRFSRFQLSDIVVNADEPELQKAVRNKAMVYFGKNLFSVSLGELEKRLKEIPTVQEARIHRRWPTKIVVDIKPRTVVALVFEKNRLWTVSADGMRIEATSSPPAVPLLKDFPELPEVRTERSIDVGLGKSADNNFNDSYAAIFRFLEKIQEQDSDFGGDSSKISEVRWKQDRGLVLWSFELGAEIDLGFENFDRAWLMTRRAIVWANERNISLASVDASYSSRVIVKARGRLQNSQIGLNLEELVRRKDPGAAAVR